MIKQYWLGPLGFDVPMSAIFIFPYIFFGVGVFRYNFLSISPIAKDWIINSLTDGIVVLSQEGEIIETNTSASYFIENYGNQLNFELLIGNEDLIEDTKHSIELQNDSGTQYFEIELHHLLTAKNRKMGSVAIVKDMTDITNRQHVLIEEADYDGLTHVYNKRALERAYSMSSANTISLLIIDIDSFKIINDTFGHPVGDVVLFGIVESMKKSIRKQDIVGRIGGDEFCIILIDCNSTLCTIISDRILDAIRSKTYQVQYELPPITVSIGGLSNISKATKTFQEAYIEADKALYKAKENGKDRAFLI